MKNSNQDLLLTEFRAFRDETRVELNQINLKIATLNGKVDALDAKQTSEFNSINQRLLNIERGFIFTVGTSVILGVIKFLFR